MSVSVKFSMFFLSEIVISMLKFSAFSFIPNGIDNEMRLTKQQAAMILLVR